MKLNRRVLLIQLGIGSVSVILAGCGGGDGGNGTNPSVAVLWRSVEHTRLTAASIALSVRVKLITPAGGSIELLAVRPESPPDAPVTYTFAQFLPAGPVRLEADFFATADGTGTILASTAGDVQIEADGKVPIATLTITDRISNVSLENDSQELTVGDTITPRLRVRVTGGESTLLPAMPLSAIRWNTTSARLRQDGAQFTAITAGSTAASVTATILNSAGEARSADINFFIQSAPPAGQRTLAPLRVLSPQTIWQNRLVGLTLNRSAVVLVDPATDSRTNLPLPEVGMVVTPDFSNNRLWLQGTDRHTLWRMSLPDGVATPYLTISPNLSWPPEVFPVSENHVLVRETRGSSSRIALYKDAALAAELSGELGVILVKDSSTFFVHSTGDSPKMTQYSIGPDGITKLSEYPTNGLPVVYSNNRFFSSTGEVRKVEDFSLERQLPFQTANTPLPVFSPSGGRVLYFNTLSNPRRLVAYDVATGQQLTDFYYFGTVLFDDPFFLDEATLAHANQENVVVLPGLI